MGASTMVAEAVWKGIESTHSVTDDQLEVLHFLFGKNFERATRIVDQRGVKRLYGVPSGRTIFQVVGESRKKEEYLCFAENYCGCYSFFYDIVNRGEQLCLLMVFETKGQWKTISLSSLTRCKHQLAARLASCLGVCIEVKLPDEEIAMLLSKL